ncbi:hypothetical protein [Halocatena halophila]|uniref:hypothetical protein n=1 Tax=Halocatena halophila TaxID=2814576 RepID=UPI002ED5E095
MPDHDDGLYPGREGADGDYEQSQRSELPALAEQAMTFEQSESSEKSEIIQRVRNFVKWLLPDDSDTDGEGRTGFLSTRVEFHALAIGGFLGLIAAHQGDVGILLTFLLGGAAGSRLPLRYEKIKITKKHLRQARKELPYTVASFAVVYGYYTVDLTTLLGQ